MHSLSEDARQLGHPLDDSYISLHSAQVLHWNADPNFPNTPPLVGITNAPYVLLLWALLFALPPLIALEAASWLGILCYALGLVALGRTFRLPLWGTLALTALGLTIAKVPYQLLNGVETGMAMGITVWILALAVANTVWSRRGAALLCGVAPFLSARACRSIRICSGRDFCSRLQTTREGCTGGTRLRAALGSYRAGGIAVAALVWSEHGIADSADDCSQTFLLCGRMRPTCLSVGCVADERTSIRRRVGSVCRFADFSNTHHDGAMRRGFCAALFFVYYEQLPSALLHNQGRYTYILVPILLLGLASGLGDRWLWARRAAYALLLFSCLQTAEHFSFHWNQFLEHRDHATQSLSSVAGWSNAHLPASATLLIHDAGYISYATKFRLVDFVGLKTLPSIELNRRYTYGRCGAGPAVAISEIARRARPDYLIVTGDWDGAFRVTPGLRSLGWSVDEINHSGDYRVFRLTPPVERRSGS